MLYAEIIADTEPTGLFGEFSFGTDSPPVAQRHRVARLHRVSFGPPSRISAGLDGILSKAEDWIRL
jgi:hypothetical protein